MTAKHEKQIKRLTFNAMHMCHLKRSLKFENNTSQ